MQKPVVLFFARGYQAQYFPTLTSPHYDAIFVTLTREERREVERRGGKVVGCFEEDFEHLASIEVSEKYLETSFMSDRFLGRYSYAKRLEIVGKEVAFWRSLLETHAPGAVVNELVAIEISEVLFIECRARQVRYLAGMNCLVDDYFYWLPNPLSLSGRFLPDLVPGPFATQLAHDYIQQVLERDYRPFYVKNLRGRRSVQPLAAAAVKWVLWRWRRFSSAFLGKFRYELYDDEYAKRLIVFFRSFTRKYDVLADLPAGKEVVYYPLHQEPEATLNYMSEFYANQPATIENILKCLTVNQVLVVKEHPVDKGSLLRDKFWSLRRNYSGLYFLPAEYHGREVLASVQRVVTLTSTVGWEAALIGKTVYVLGKIFYDGLKVVTAIANFDDLKRHMHSALPAGRVDNAYIERFVASMTEFSAQGNPFPHAALYSEVNRQRVTGAIAQRLVS